MRLRFVLWVAATSACFHPSYDGTACGTGDSCPGGYTCNTTTQVCESTGTGRDIDAGGDGGTDAAAVDAPPTALCVGHSLNVCVAPRTSDLALGDTINTDSSPQCVPYTSTPAVDACVIAGKSITLSAGKTVRAIGKKKLIFIASDSITIGGTLDASSTETLLGAAAVAGPCNAATAPTAGGGAGAGGAGGSFQSGGGPGGAAGAGMAGVPATTILFAGLALRGGCPGDNGAKLTESPGVGGQGGGAVALLATAAVTITGVINASGAGGITPLTPAHGGGGGGGSGGMILLDAKAVTIPAGAQCFANGGGGGGGSTAVAGTSGGVSTAPVNVAPGGMGGGAGGDGGRGAIRANAAGVGQSGVNAGGGGGGGGGTGYIVIVATSTQVDNTTVSPMPNIVTP